MTDSHNSSVPNTKNRPLSPHLSIYKLPLTAAIMSITHRATGVALAAGLVLFVMWIWSAAYCPTSFEWLQTHQDTWWMRLALIGWSAALFYHLLNGIRHLGWDAGSGFSLPAAERSGWIVLVGTVILTMLVWGPHYCPILNAGTQKEVIVEEQPAAPVSEEATQPVEGE